jgi:hypothetical protein
MATHNTANRVLNNGRNTVRTSTAVAPAMLVALKDDDLASIYQMIATVIVITMACTYIKRHSHPLPTTNVT